MPVYNFFLSIFIEFGPTLGFFIGATYYDFFIGVRILIVLTILSLCLSYLRDRMIPKFSLVSSTFILLFGFATLYSQNPYYIVLEYTLYNLLFAVAAVVLYFFNMPLMKILFHTMFSITDRGWHKLSLRWAFFFFITAVGNEITWNFFSQDVWVYYRFIASIVLAIFGFSQFFLARKERLPDSSPWGLRMFGK